METYKAKIQRGEEKTSLVFVLGDQNLEIILTEDNSLEIKKIFNELVKELKKREFNFELEDEEKDLYQEISIEYIKQLNSEITKIYKELKDYKLLSTEVAQKKS